MLDTILDILDSMINMAGDSQAEDILESMSDMTDMTEVMPEALMEDMAEAAQEAVADNEPLISQIQTPETPGQVSFLGATAYDPFYPTQPVETCLGTIQTMTNDATAAYINPTPSPYQAVETLTKTKFQTLFDQAQTTTDRITSEIAEGMAIDTAQRTQIFLDKIQKK